MATNLVSNVSQTLTPDLLRRIASALGLDKSVVEKAMSAGIPALLAAFMSRASTPQGAASLNDAVANEQPGTISSLANSIGGSGQTALIDSGRNRLTSLLGGNTANALAGAIDKFAGIGGVASRSVMGLLAPVVMSVLGQQQKSSGYSAAQLLVAQKDNIARALPAGFSRYLRGTGILDGIKDVEAVADEPDYEHAAPRAAEHRSDWGWVLPALGLLALFGIAWYLLSGPRGPDAIDTTRTTQAPSPDVVKAPEVAALEKLNGIKAGDVDLGQHLTNTVNGLRTSLDSVKDEATAQAAMPALSNAGSEFDKLTGLTGQLSPETRKTLASAITALRPTLDQMFDKALAIPGVAAVIKPAIDAIRAKLDALATTA